jgi:hypothetical protein
LLEAFGELKTLSEALLTAPDEALMDLLSKRESLLASLEKVTDLPDDIKLEASAYMEAIMMAETKLLQRVQAIHLRKTQLMQQILSLKGTQQTLSGYKPSDLPSPGRANHWG